jgi:TRAP-type C4-dicarboxylate transport system substrate-binding protein
MRTLIAALTLCTLAAPLHAAKYNVRWHLGHANLDYFEQAAAEFKQAVEKGSHGEIAVEIVTAPKDEDSLLSTTASPEIAGLVAKGDIEMGHSFTDVMSGMDPKLMAFEAPYLMRGYRHMEGIFEGPSGDKLLAEMKDRGLTGLSFTYSGGASGIASLSKEIRKPEDLKGLKVGVFGDAVNAAWLESLGATPVPIGHKLSSILPLAREGKLDAVVITWRNFERTALNQKFRYFNLPGSTYLVSVTYANAKWFESLPKQYRELIVKASHDAGLVERQRTIELNESAKQQMLGKGVRAVYLSEEGRKTFEASLASAYAKIEPLLGKSFVDELRAVPDASAHPALPGDPAGR